MKMKSEKYTETEQQVQWSAVFTAYTHPLSRQIVNLQTSTKVSSLPVRFCRLVTQCQRLRFVLRFWRYIN